MSTLVVNHPNPALALPSKTLACQIRMVTGFESFPVGCKDNVAFTNPQELLSYAVETATKRVGTFVVVSWGWINAEPINPIAYLCFDGKRFLFTPINYGNEDFDARCEGMTEMDICHAINREYREDRLGLEARRQWTTIPLVGQEPVDQNLVQRASLILSAVVFRTHMKQEDLYDLAI